MTKIPLKYWLIIWCSIYTSFLIIDFISPYAGLVTFLKYAGILLNLLYAHQKFPSDHYLKLALIFTLLGDTILTIDHIAYLGVLAFCVAQFFHLIRLTGLRVVRSFIIYFSIIALSVGIAFFCHFEPIYSLATCYGVVLATNLIISVTWLCLSGSYASRYAFAGFLLFSFCDIFVGTSYLARVGVFPAVFHQPADYLAWAFYYPSQVFMANSSKSLAKPNKI